MQQLTMAQSHSMPHILGGKNVVLVSPPSTGKTLSYLLPLLSKATNCSGSKVNLDSLVQ